MEKLLNTDALLSELQVKQVVSRLEWQINIRLPSGECNPDLSYRLDFKNCDLSGSSFIDTQMKGVKLQGSVLDGCQMGSVNLENANLSRVSLKSASLVGANLCGANLQGASLQNADLHFALLNGTRLDRRGIGSGLIQESQHEYIDARFIYLQLKNNFISIGAYDDAAWAYRMERTMERKSLSPRNCRRFYSEELQATQQDVACMINRLTRRSVVGSEPLEGDLADVLGEAIFRLRYFVKYMGHLFLGAPWGYGQKLQNALGICLVIIAIFALFFWRLGGIETLTSRSLSLPDYLLYSAGAFAIVGFNDLYPATFVAKCLTVAEALLGLATFAIFVNALGQRIGGR